MSLSLFHRSIGGNTTFLRDSIVLGNWALGGAFKGLTDPIMWFYNGSTYAVGYESNVYNNKAWIIKQTGLSVEGYAVNTGTSSPEPLNHPTPLLYINESTGYIYVIQNQFHVDAFDVWKSDSPEDISAFTKVTGSFDTDGSYLVLNKYSGTNCTFTTRSGNNPGGYDHNILHVDLDDPNSYTDVKVCEGIYATNNTRFYPTEVHRYGTSSYYVGGANLRDDTHLTTYIKGIWITTDFETFEDIAQTYSKDIIATSELTFAEFTTNLNEFGSVSTRTNNYEALGLMQIDNNIYTAVKTATNELTFYKFTIGTAGSVANFVIPYSVATSDTFYMYYNGTDIVLTFGLSTGEIYLGTIDTGLTAFDFKRELDLEDAIYTGLPWNFDQIPSNTKYLIASRSDISEPAGTSPYIITDNTF